jgi:SAM-dependent methyltransferase
LPIERFTRQNRRAWDEISHPRRERFPSAEFFASGRSTLRPFELAAAGDVAGKRLLHLQCAGGHDTLSWAVAGAVVTGVNISPVAIQGARQMAAVAGLPARFLEADVYELPDELQAGDFDVVYTGGGAICWLPDLQRWAQTVERAAREGSRLIVFEMHPHNQVFRLVDGRWVLVADYFGRGGPVISSGGLGSLACGAESRETICEFHWPLGDLVMSLAGAGFRVEWLEEFPNDVADEVVEEFEEEGMAWLRQLPGSFLLVARKEQAR